MRLPGPPSPCEMRFCLALRSRPDAVRDTLVDLRAALQRAEHPAGSWPDWEIVLAEALNNVVEHAYQEAPDGTISLMLRFDAAELEAELRDDGHPMPDLRLPGGKRATPEDLPEGGFGWFLIRQMTRRLDYARIDGQNVLRFRMSMPG